jgi:hypothetical protein
MTQSGHQLVFEASIGKYVNKFQGTPIMPKTDIRLLAAAAEIVASVAVVASLIFVVVSLNQNTAALQSINDNLVYELQDARFADTSNIAELADLVVKAGAGEVLSKTEQLRFEYWVLRDLNLWELAFSRHSEGMMPPSQWLSWDESFTDLVISRFPEETWKRYGTGYGEEFKKHVDAAYAEQ